MFPIQSTIIINQKEEEIESNISGFVSKIKESIHAHGGVIPKNINYFGDEMPLMKWLGRRYSDLSEKLFLELKKEIPELIPRGEDFLEQGKFLSHVSSSNMNQHLKDSIAKAVDGLGSADHIKAIRFFENVLFFNDFQFVTFFLNQSKIVELAQDIEPENSFLKVLCSKQDHLASTIAYYAYMTGHFDKVLPKVVKDENGNLSHLFVKYGLTIGGRGFLERKLFSKEVSQSVWRSFLEEGETIFLRNDAESVSLLLKDFRIATSRVEKFTKNFLPEVLLSSNEVIRELIKHPQLRDMLQKNADVLLKKVLELHPPEGSPIEERVKLVASLGGKPDVISTVNFRDKSAQEIVLFFEELGLRKAAEKGLIDQAFDSLNKNFIQELKDKNIVCFDESAVEHALIKYRYGQSKNVLEFLIKNFPNEVNQAGSFEPPWWQVVGKKNVELLWKNLKEKTVSLKAKDGKPYPFFLLEQQSKEEPSQVIRSLKFFLSKAKGVDLGLNYQDKNGNNIMHLLLEQPFGFDVPDLEEIYFLMKDRMGLTGEILKILVNQKNNEGKTPIDFLLENSKRFRRIDPQNFYLSIVEDILPAIDFQSHGTCLSNEFSKFIDKVNKGVDQDPLRLSLEKVMILVASGEKLEKPQRGSVFKI